MMVVDVDVSENEDDCGGKVCSLLKENDDDDDYAH